MSLNLACTDNAATTMSAAVCLGGVAAFSGDHANAVNGVLNDPYCNLKTIAKGFSFQLQHDGLRLT